MNVPSGVIERRLTDFLPSSRGSTAEVKDYSSMLLCGKSTINDW